MNALFTVWVVVTLGIPGLNVVIIYRSHEPLPHKPFRHCPKPAALPKGYRKVCAAP